MKTPDEGFKSRPPDLILKAKSKAGGGGRRIGAGWVNDVEGGQTVSIQLDTCVTISWNDGVFLLLVPSKEEARE